MTDNIIQGKFAIAPGSASSQVAGGGGPPHDPGMEQRVAKLEAGLTDIKITLARIETALGNVATRSDMARIEGTAGTLDAKLAALDARVGRVETGVGAALNTAVGKAIGPVQFVAMLAGAAAVLAGGAGAYAWVAHQPWFPH